MLPTTLVDRFEPCWPSNTERERLEDTLDDLCDRYGERIVRRSSNLLDGMSADRQRADRISRAGARTETHACRQIICG